MWVRFIGAPRDGYLPDHFRFVPMILPVSEFNRPGVKLWGGSGNGTINHETDNPRLGTGAINHGNYLLGGPKDQYGNRLYVSWHFCVDGGVTGNPNPTISQSVPLDEITYQAACGNCGGNNDRWSIEQAVNADGDRARARDAHEWLAASVHEVHEVHPDGTTDLHWDWNAADPDRHDCPFNMRHDGYVPTFRANVIRKFDTIKGYRAIVEGGIVPYSVNQKLIWPGQTSGAVGALWARWSAEHHSWGLPTDRWGIPDGQGGKLYVFTNGLVIRKDDATGKAEAL